MERRPFSYEASSEGSAAASARRALPSLILAPAVVVALAVDGGGYDIVVRQLAALACWWLLALGFAFGYLPRGRPALVVRLPLIAAVGLVLWMAASLAWGASDERALEQIARTLGYLGGGVLVVATLGTGSWRRAGAGLVAGAVAVCAVAMASRLAPGTLHSSAAFVDAFGTKRLAYPLDYWNAVGAVASIALVMAIPWSAHAGSPWWRALALAATPLAGAVIYLTYSRTALIAVVLGTVASIALGHNRRVAFQHAVAAALGTAVVVLTIRSEPQIALGSGSGGASIVAASLVVAAAGCAQAAHLSSSRARRPARIPAVAANAAVLVAFLAALAIVPHAASAVPALRATASSAPQANGRDISNRLTSTGGPRGELWTTGLRAFRDNPVEGLGAGSYEFYWNRTTSNGDPLRDAHSVVITSMAELGAPGLLLLGALAAGLVGLCVIARRRVRAPADAGAVAALLAGFGVFALSAAVDWSYEIPAVTALGIGCVAVVGCSLSGPRSAPRRTGPSLAVVALAVLAGLVQVPGIVGNQLARASAAAAASGATDRAAELAADAASAEPWAATPRLQQSVVALRAGNAAAAARFAKEATAREPDDYYARFLLAQYQLRAKERAAGIASLRVVAELRPAIATQIRRAISFYRGRGAGG